MHCTRLFHYSSSEIWSINIISLWRLWRVQGTTSSTTLNRWIIIIILFETSTKFHIYIYILPFIFMILKFKICHLKVLRQRLFSALLLLWECQWPLTLPLCLNNFLASSSWHSHRVLEDKIHRRPGYSLHVASLLTNI